MDKNILEQTLISINQKKQEMLQELKSYPVLLVISSNINAISTRQI